MSAASIAREWLGTPYHSGARIKGIGVDCGQLLIAVYETEGSLAPGECSPGIYSNEWHLHRSEEKYLSWIIKYCDRVSESEAKEGDIALFRFGRCVSHGGIVTEWPHVIHAYVGQGVIESDIHEAMLCDKSGHSRLYGIYRPRVKTR